MTLKQSGPIVVRPNTLRSQSVPNTFRTSSAPATPADRRGSTSRAPSAAVRKQAARRRLPVWVLAAAIALALIFALYLLNPTP